MVIPSPGFQRQSRFGRQELRQADNNRIVLSSRIQEDDNDHDGEKESLVDDDYLVEKNTGRTDHDHPRRQFLARISMAATPAWLDMDSAWAATTLSEKPPPSSMKTTTAPYLRQVVDPGTYSALLYEPPKPPIDATDSKTTFQSQKTPNKLPLIVFLVGAGDNSREESAWSLTAGQYAGLLPNLLATNQAPSQVEDFVIVAPYVGKGKRSFYDEPRGKILRFVEYICQQQEQQSSRTAIDRDRIYLFGFSDGATVAVELATTRKFRAIIVCSYGFSGTLPPQALERLDGIPMWVWHSADDAIFPVAYSDRFVSSLQKQQQLTKQLPTSSADSQSHPTNSIIKYTRFDHDPEGFSGSVRGHTMGITASKSSEVFSWLLSKK